MLQAEQRHSPICDLQHVEKGTIHGHPGALFCPAWALQISASNIGCFGAGKKEIEALWSLYYIPYS